MGLTRASAALNRPASSSDRKEIRRALEQRIPDLGLEQAAWHSAREENRLALPPQPVKARGEQSPLPQSNAQRVTGESQPAPTSAGYEHTVSAKKDWTCDAVQQLLFKSLPDFSQQTRP